MGKREEGEMIEIPGYSGYFATADGHIVSTKRGRNALLAENPDRDGYLRVQITRNDGKSEKARVNILVALAYHGPRPSMRHLARHLDGSRHRNNPENLAWGTTKQNYMDAVGHGTRAHGESVGGWITPRDVVERVMEAADKGLRGVDIARALGISTAQVSRIRNRKRWAEYAPMAA